MERKRRGRRGGKEVERNSGREIMTGAGLTVKSKSKITLLKKYFSKK